MNSLLLPFLAVVPLAEAISERWDSPAIIVGKLAVIFALVNSGMPDEKRYFYIVKTNHPLASQEDAPALIAELAIWLREQKIPLTELRVGHGSLEDVFLRLTGTEMKE